MSLDPLQRSFQNAIPNRASADVYTDLNGLQKLKTSARKNAQRALPEVARQFEAVMIAMMLKNLRKTGMEDPIFKSQAMDSYRDMYDQQLSMELSKGRGIGLAESIVQQLQHQSGQSMPIADNQQVMPLTLPERRQFPGNYAPVKSEHIADTAQAGKNINDSISESNVDYDFKTPEQFVEVLWPIAEKTAKKLGIGADVILSQAALETGWGKHVISQGNNSSFNLFNIKADRHWQGEKMTKVSMEYIHGKPVQQKSDFRAYNSYEQSFDDYASLIQNSPRYKKALNKINVETEKTEQSLHGTTYIKAIHKAGYATDPNYADKVLRVINSDAIQNQRQSALKLASK